MKHVIEVHQYGVKHFEVESLAEAAYADGWDVDKFNSKEELAEYYEGEEIPAVFNGVAFPLILEKDSNGEILAVTAAADWNEEKAASAYLAADLNRLIVIETFDDAEYYAEKYRGHEEIEVNRIARWIADELKTESED